MDLTAIAEATVEMYCLVDAKLTARQREGLLPTDRVEIFKEAMSLYITQVINEKKYGTTKQAEIPSTEKPTGAQIKYALDLGCKNPQSYSKEDLSKWIDENK